MHYYKILEVPITATTEEINVAYRNLAIKYHPDSSKDPNSVKKFKEIAAAHETLSDKGKRAQYNLRYSILISPPPKQRPVQKPSSKPKPTPKPTPKPKSDPQKQYPHNVHTINDANKPIPPDLRGTSLNGDVGTVDLWKQSGLEEYEKPAFQYYKKQPRQSNFIDP